MQKSGGGEKNRLTDPLQLAHHVLVDELKNFPQPACSGHTDTPKRTSDKSSGVRNGGACGTKCTPIEGQMDAPLRGEGHSISVCQEYTLDGHAHHGYLNDLLFDPLEGLGSKLLPLGRVHFAEGAFVPAAAICDLQQERWCETKQSSLVP